LMLAAMQRVRYSVNVYIHLIISPVIDFGIDMSSVRSAFWDYTLYFYHLSRSNLNYNLVGQTWFIFSVILILFTFQCHFMFIQFECGFKIHPAQRLYALQLHNIHRSSNMDYEMFVEEDDEYDDSDQCLSPTINQELTTFRHQTCKWHFDHAQHIYNQCVANNETNLLLWMLLIIIICVLIHFVFHYFPTFWGTVLNKLIKRDRQKHQSLQRKIQSFHCRQSQTHTQRLRDILDKLSYVQNNQILLPVELRELIVDMAQYQLTPCKQCCQIICEHVQTRYISCKPSLHANTQNMELWRMNMAYILSHCAVTLQLLMAYTICILLIAICLYGVYFITMLHNIFIVFAAIIINCVVLAASALTSL